MLIRRHIAEKPTGLVLSGGGFKGGFQIGALRHLHQRQPELFKNIVSYGGSSIGGINALGLAVFKSRGFDFEQSLKKLEEFWLKAAEEKLLHYSFAGVIKTIYKKLLGNIFTFQLNNDSVYKPQPIENIFKELLGNQQNLTIGALEKLVNVRLFITGTCLETDSTEVFGSDVNVLDAMMATGALPGAFPPRLIKGRHYSDGGIYRNTPLKDVVNPESNGWPEVTRIITVFLDPKPTYDKVPKVIRKLATNALDMLTGVLNQLHTRVNYEEFKETLRINEHLLNYQTDMLDIENYKNLLKNKALSKKKRQEYSLALERNIYTANLFNLRYRLQQPGQRPKRFIEFIKIFPLDEMDTLDESPEAMKKNIARGKAGRYLLETIQ